MAHPCILVLDESPAIRETVAILLGADFEVEVAAPEEYLSRPPPRQIPGLVIAAESEPTRRALAGLAGKTRVLWLVAGPETEKGPLPEGNESSISRRFSPYELRRRVEAMLARPVRPEPGERYRARLLPPYVPPEVSPVLVEAAASDLPLLLLGEAGVGKRTVARAVHARRGTGILVCTTAATFSVTDPRLDAQGGTVYIEGIEQLEAAEQQALLTCLDPGGTVASASGFRFRLVSASTGDVTEDVEAGRFSPELYYRLSVLAARLPPLRERAADVPALAAAVAADLEGLLGLPPVSFTDAAFDRLSHYLWFGNLAELEAVLVRTLSIRRKKLIDADDLLFEGRHLGQTTRPTRRSAGEAGRPASVDPANLDMIINELAHEFKNPLVTIKTFAQQIRRSLAQGGDQEQVAALTGDAVEQIDQTLENLLEFTRLKTPAPASLALADVVTPAAEELGQALAERGATVDYESPPPVQVSVDPAQASYALHNLLRALSRDVGPKSGQLRIRFAPPAGIAVDMPTGRAGIGAHLARWLDTAGDDNGASSLPLGAAIAVAVLERNGARIVFGGDAEPNTVTVQFAVASDQKQRVRGNGQTPRPHR